MPQSKLKPDSSSCIRNKTIGELLGKPRSAAVENKDVMNILLKTLDSFCYTKSATFCFVFVYITMIYNNINSDALFCANNDQKTQWLTISILNPERILPYVLQTNLKKRRC